MTNKKQVLSGWRLVAPEKISIGFVKGIEYFVQTNKNDLTYASKLGNKERIFRLAF